MNNTGNPIPSTNALDFQDNLENLDRTINSPALTYTDRMGIPRKSWAGFEADFAAFLAASGFETPVLTYTDGVPLQVDRPTQLLERASAPGTLYSIKLPSSFPVILSGTWATDEPLLVVRIDQSLRDDLADPAGAELVGHDAGTVADALNDLDDRLVDIELITAGHIRPYDPEFGAVANGIADDTAALLACLSDGRPVYMGDDSKNYRITSEISYAATRAVVIHSNSAKVTVDSPANIRSAIRIDLAGKGLYVSGRLFIEGQNKTFSGFYATNYGAAIAKVDALVSGLDVRNCYRNSTVFTGGDGIWIAGNFIKLIVEQVTVIGVKMAAGAGVIGAQGVSGVTLSRDNTNNLDASLVVLRDFNIENIYSEDVAYTSDQDGVRIFSAYNSPGDTPRPVAAVVTTGRTKNCHGRAIKIQSENAIVDKIKIERNGDIYGGGFSGNPDIDFQVSGGQVSNVQAYYSSNFPSRLLQFSLTQTDTRLNQTAVEVNNVQVSQVGSGTGFDRFMTVVTDFDATALVNLSGVQLFGSKVPLYMLTLQSLVATGWFGVNVDGMAGRASVNFVYRLSSVAVPCFITGKAIFNAGGSVPFAGSAVAGDFTTSLLGANRFVT